MKTRLADWDIETLRWVAEGHSHEEIAGILDTTIDVIKSRLRSSFKILNAKNAAHAVALAHIKHYLPITHYGPANPQLSNAHLDILLEIARGKDREQVARDNGLTMHQVKYRLKHLHRQLGAKNAPHLIYLGFQTGNIITKPRRPPEETHG